MRKKTKLNKNEALDKFGTIWNKEKIQALLEKNDEAVYRALMKIYDRQTADEQEYQDTTEYNTVGFTGVDGHILSSFAEYYKKWGKLSEKYRKKWSRRVAYGAD